MFHSAMLDSPHPPSRHLGTILLFTSGHTGRMGSQDGRKSLATMVSTPPKTNMDPKIDGF